MYTSCKPAGFDEGAFSPQRLIRAVPLCGNLLKGPTNRTGQNEAADALLSALAHIHVFLHTSMRAVVTRPQSRAAPTSLLIRSLLVDAAVHNVQRAIKVDGTHEVDEVGYFVGLGFLSLEPALHPDQVLQRVRLTKSCLDHLDVAVATVFELG